MCQEHGYLRRRLFNCKSELPNEEGGGDLTSAYVAKLEEILKFQLICTHKDTVHRSRGG